MLLSFCRRAMEREYPSPDLLELDVRKNAREIEHVIDQHQAHQDQITTQDLERQTYARGHCNLSKTIARTFLLWQIVEWMDDTKLFHFCRNAHGCHPSPHELKRLGSITCAAKSSDRAKRTTMIVQLMTLFHDRFTQRSPSNSRSLRRS